MVGQEVLKALQRGWECWVPLQRTSKGQMDNVTPCCKALEEGVLSGCYLPRRRGEVPEQKPGGGCGGMALSQQKQQIRIKKKNNNSKLSGAKWCPKESRKEKQSKCWDFPRQACLARPRCRGNSAPWREGSTPVAWKIESIFPTMLEWIGKQTFT